MKFISKIFITLLLFSSMVLPFLCKTHRVMAQAERNRFLYLVAGFDDSAQNTDVLFALSYDAKGRTASIVQIPRDTYFSFGSSQNKINQMYAFYRNRGFGEKESMQYTTNAIGTALGVGFDGYFAFTTGAFRKMVDALGGVVVNIPESFVYSDEHGDNAFSLDTGDNLLNGEKAEIFVRYRKGYALGDLARIDAQKIFISGLYKTITERIGYSEILRVIAVASDGVITDFSVSDIISMLFNKKGSIDGITFKYVTLPGEALQDETGLWYYVLNKKSATEVVEKYLMVENADFDTNNVFVKKDNMLFNNIYDDQNFKYKEYTDDSIKDMNIIKQ